MCISIAIITLICFPMKNELTQLKGEVDKLSLNSNYSGHSLPVLSE